ncbi:MAG: DUF4956 domain-containing protein [Clostridiales bacterium]|nr:DUF4956 domain-containing protein [Clostridiales bacterium]
MTFNDIFKSSFLEQVSNFSFLDTVISLALAFAIGLFIFEIYRKTYRGVMYSRSFGITLLALAIITDLAIMTVTSNVVLSLGMVGALSIVRFRTAIKEPLDIAFLFWSIVVGIMLGAGMIPLAVFGSIILGVILLVYSNHKTLETPYILVVQCANDDVEQKVNEYISNAVKRFNVKSKTVNASGIELTLEIRLADSTTQFVNDLNAMDGVEYATLVSYNGEYMA